MIRDLIKGVSGIRGGAVMGLIIGLLVLWVVLVVIGFTVKALLWLAIVGIVLFLVTGVFGAIRGRSGRALR
ncbi:MAG: hypothetical protein DLM61_08870 [Pseudonocardiales bacterium]|nr:MAG: hypothetical protein DLM61_08870 [Pseudonocardiales bacterium]